MSSWVEPILSRRENVLHSLKPAASQSQVTMGESSKFPKSGTFENQILKLAHCQKYQQFQNLNGHLSLDKLKSYQRSH